MVYITSQFINWRYITENNITMALNYKALLLFFFYGKSTIFIEGILYNYLQENFFSTRKAYRGLGVSDPEDVEGKLTEAPTDARPLTNP